MWVRVRGRVYTWHVQMLSGYFVCVCVCVCVCVRAFVMCVRVRLSHMYGCAYACVYCTHVFVVCMRVQRVSTYVHVRMYVCMGACMCM